MHGTRKNFKMAASSSAFGDVLYRDGDQVITLGKFKFIINLKAAKLYK